MLSINGPLYVLVSSQLAGCVDAGLESQWKQRGFVILAPFMGNNFIMGIIHVIKMSFIGPIYVVDLQWSPWENWTYNYSQKNTKYQNKTVYSCFPIYTLCFFYSLFLCPLFLLTLSRSLSGPTPNSPSLATLSGDLPTPFNLTTSGHQFLVRWSSDHGTNKKGFKIRYVGEYQSMYPNFILLLLYIIMMHGNKDRDRQKDRATFWIK